MKSREKAPFVDDERLLIQAAQKDRNRFAELYENHFERVYSYVVKRIGDRAEAQDVTSEVFHQALANLDRFEWRGAPFAAWLFRIAANALADRFKRMSRERSIPANPETSEPKEPSLEDVEERARLFKLVDRLPADQRRVIVERFVEQKSIREIARDLKRTEGAVKQLQLRAIESLRARMSN